MLPRARKDDLVVQELAEETLVYDRKRDKAHCLNRAAALVWRQCDGQTTPAEIARILRHEFQTPADERFVWLALDRLGRARLLAERITSPDPRLQCSRRDLARKLGIAMVAAPLVMTILAPSVAMAASCGGVGASCGHQGNPPCCTGLECSGGRCKH
jgi:hypothetical protein